MEAAQSGQITCLRPHCWPRANSARDPGSHSADEQWPRNRVKVWLEPKLQLKQRRQQDWGTGEERGGKFWPEEGEETTTSRRAVEAPATDTGCPFGPPTVPSCFGFQFEAAAEKPFAESPSSVDNPELPLAAESPHSVPLPSLQLQGPWQLLLTVHLLTVHLYAGHYTSVSLSLRNCPAGLAVIRMQVPGRQGCW